MEQGDAVVRCDKMPRMAAGVLVVGFPVLGPPPGSAVIADEKKPAGPSGRAGCFHPLSGINKPLQGICRA
jgi:hypothetical protein